jgi:eukaryotic-like serine/threonine-protein kinase
MGRVMRDTSPERLREIDALFDSVLDLSPSAREMFLDRACHGDPALREAVQRLIEARHASADFLELPGLAVAEPVIQATDLAESAAAPASVGPFRIGREIGHGGMGAVFLGTREDGQFDQRVALKLIRQLGAPALVARFLDERRILALLEHPHIARLVDGGVTGDGVPWFAMEYVDGEPIDRYCDSRSLSVEERLDLFATVCEAVQYAHKHLVIHRDLKPSNILVGVDGQLKLLDFGVAKLIDHGQQSPDAQAAKAAALPMTPEYAAPEQVRGDHVTAAADVYALGVLLYALLTGQRPYEVRGRSPTEIERVICELEPRRPSDTFADAHDTRSAASQVERASRRGSTSGQLRRTLAGDLDAIVLKALNKEPEARYASASELVQDIRRYLSGHPVLARPQTAAYRARRFVRRHRIETVAAFGISLSMVMGSMLALVQARHARAERDRAELASRETQAVNAFLLQLFEASDPSEARGDTLTARELVQRAASRVDRFRGDTVEHARLLEVTGRLYQSLGQYEPARELTEQALALRRRTAQANDDDLDVAADLVQLSNTFVRLSRFNAADSTARNALIVQERRLGPNHPSLATTLHQLASVAVYRGNLTAAEAYHRRALAVRVGALGEEDSLSAFSHFLLGTTLRREGKFADAEREFRHGIATSERALGREHPQVASGELLLADLLDEDEGRDAEAGPLYYRALEIRRRAYGDGHPIVAYAVADLAGFLSRQGDGSAAIPLARQYLSMLQRAFGANHPVVISATGQVAGILERAHADPEAENLLRRAMEMSRRILGPDHATVAGNEIDLARLLMRRGEYAEAREMVRDAIRIGEKDFGPEHPVTARMRAVNGLLLMRERHYVAADSTLRAAVQTVERQLGRASPMARELYGWLADLEDAQSHHAEAARDRAIAVAR